MGAFLPVFLVDFGVNLQCCNSLVVHLDFMPLYHAGPGLNQSQVFILVMGHNELPMKTYEWFEGMEAV